MRSINEEEDQMFRYYDSQFNLARYMSLVKLIAFGNEREHADGLCCFLPRHWRINKQIVRDIYLIHGYLASSGITHKVIYEGERPQPPSLPEDPYVGQIELLINEYEELCKRTPHRKEIIPEGERFVFEGVALPACSNLDFKISNEGVIVNSCRIYPERDKYCSDYPAYGTSEFDPLCIYDGWSTKPSLTELRSGSVQGTQLKLFAVKLDLAVPKNLVFDQLQLNGETYNLISAPPPKRSCPQNCIQHPKYRKIREEETRKFFLSHILGSQH